MNVLQKVYRGMDFHSNKNSRNNGANIRGSNRSVENSYRSSHFWRVSWIARRTWVPAISAGANKRGVRAVKVYYAMNIFLAIYLMALAGGVVVTVVMWQ